jgi:hypothetical protein
LTFVVKPEPVILSEAKDLEVGCRPRIGDPSFTQDDGLFVTTNMKNIAIGERGARRPHDFASHRAYLLRAMLHYFKFRQELFDPAPAKDVYIKRGAGKGWPEECPPIRAANSFGFDLLANFDVTFVRSKNGWKVEDDVVIESDFDYASSEDGEGRPLSQQYAWFWEKGQKLPHVITDNVYDAIKNQVKISSYLFLKTDANELLMMTDVPNLVRPWRAMSALIDTDWYPASYPWHGVVDLVASEKRIEIKKGDALCRVMPVRRDTYFAQQMTPHAFDDFFARGPKWLATHGKFEHEGTVDITRTYVRQQVKSKFVVLE